MRNFCYRREFCIIHRDIIGIHAVIYRQVILKKEPKLFKYLEEFDMLDSNKN